MRGHRKDLGGVERDRGNCIQDILCVKKKILFSIKGENAISCIISTIRVATLIVFSEKRSV